MHTAASIFTILFYIWVASEILIQLLTRTWKAGETRDRGSLIALLVVISLSITLGLLYAARHHRTMRPPQLAWLAIALLAAGLALRWTAILQLGRAFSANVAIRAGQSLHRTGLFSIVRHPSYTGLLLVFAGIGLWTRNWVAVLIILLPTTAVLLVRIHVEEQALREAFGEQYTLYSRTTRRRLPGLY